jgi:hypothetical protein
MAFYVIGQHAEEDMGLGAALKPVADRAHQASFEKRLLGCFPVASGAHLNRSCVKTCTEERMVESLLFVGVRWNSVSRLMYSHQAI